jgi:hypothetical protein
LNKLRGFLNQKIQFIVVTFNIFKNLLSIIKKVLQLKGYRHLVVENEEIKQRIDIIDKEWSDK